MKAVRTYLIEVEFWHPTPKLLPAHNPVIHAAVDFMQRSIGLFQRVTVWNERARRHAKFGLKVHREGDYFQASVAKKHFSAAHVIFGWDQQNARKYFVKDMNLVVGVMFIFWHALVRHAILRRNFKGGAPQDLQVKPKRAPPQIFLVKSHLLWNGQLIAAIDLRPTGQAWHQVAHAARGGLT